jgi:hypothetical protein
MGKKPTKKEINIFEKKASACLTRTKDIVLDKNRKYRLID